jgi:hypothetical protein
LSHPPKVFHNCGKNCGNSGDFSAAARGDAEMTGLQEGAKVLEAFHHAGISVLSPEFPI